MPERVQEDRHGRHRDPVEERCRPRVPGRANELRHKRRRVRDERDRHQEQDVQEEEEAVDANDVPEERVVVDPDDPDRYEADDVARVRGPLVEEDVSEGLTLGQVRPLEEQHEQRDRDREDAVAERLEAGRLHRRPRSLRNPP